MDIVQKAVHHLNAWQTPVVTFDQPLYAISKQIQWTLPEMYGEDMLQVCCNVWRAAYRDDSYEVSGSLVKRQALS
jgi:hypothetical protein